MRVDCEVRTFIINYPNASSVKCEVHINSSWLGSPAKCENGIPWISLTLNGNHPLISMDVHGYSWISMETHRKSIEIQRYQLVYYGYPQKSILSMDINGFLWISTDIHGYLLILMDILLISIDIHGYPWISMDIHGYIHRYPWIFVDIHWYQMNFYRYA